MRSLLYKCLIGLCALGATGAHAVNYGEALQKSIYFYEAQQAGELPDWNRVEWRGDSTPGDGADNGVDLSGGWFDAGDHVKFGFPMASSATMLAWGVVEYPEAYNQTGQMQHIRNNLRFVADYFIDAHPSPNVLYGQVGTGSDDHAWWGPAEVVHLSPRAASDRPSFAITTSCPGSDLAGETAAAMAAMSMVFADTDPAYADELLSHARDLYDFAWNYRGVYTDCITDASSFYDSHSGYNDELVWSALWLHRATGEQFFLDRAVADYADLNTEPQSDVKSYKWTHAWDDKSYGAYVLLSKATSDATYRADAERWLDFWTTGYNGEQVPYTAGGLAQLDQWGATRYAANTAFVALVYSDYLSEADPNNARLQTYYDFAVGQIEYIMGDNPNGIPYQIGMSPDGPQNPHHRTAHGSWADSIDTPEQSRHLLIGALVGGPSSGDSYSDDRSNYVMNEVATDYNAGFTSALARLYLDFGGDPIPESQFPPAEEKGLEYFVEAKLNSSGPRYVELGTITRNHTAWPARIGEDLTLRYWVDLTAEFDAGYTISDFSVTTAYSQATGVSDLQVWGDGAEDIYYVDVSFADQDIIPAGQSASRREVQFRISLPTGSNAAEWDNSEDPSWDGYGSSYQQAPAIALYDGNELVWGEEPSPACGGGTGINCLPAADDVSAETDFETPVDITLSGSDSDGSIAAYNVDPPSNGTLSGNGPAVTYTPDTGFFGTDSFTYTVTDDAGGTSDTATVNVTVGEPTTPAVSITSHSDGQEVVTGTDMGISYSLSNADGVIVLRNGAQVAEDDGSGGPVLVVAPSTPGDFLIEVIAVDGNGNQLDASDSVTLAAVENESPVPEFTVSVSNQTVTVDASATTDPENDSLVYNWNFGDGNTGSGQTDTHTYSAGGTYTIVLTVDDSYNTAQTAQDVTVEDSPVSACEVDYNISNDWGGGFQADITITNNSGAQISGWELVFDLGSGESLSGSWNANVTSSGSTVTASNPAGHWNGELAPNGGTATFGIQADNSSPPANVPETFTLNGEVCGGEIVDNNPPTASATASPTSGQAPLSVGFDASGSTDPDGDTLSYSWDFGDGNAGTGATPDHSYSAAGDYTATVTVSDGEFDDTADVTISVSDSVNTPPVADATATPTSGQAPLTVSFSASGSTDADGDTLSYSWDFGDGGNTSTAVAPGHTYDSAGEYTATVTVSDGNNSDTASVTINVTGDSNSAPIATATASPTSGDAPLSVAFDASGSTDPDGDPLTYNWDFGDGSTGTGVSPSHSYTAAGDYTATVTVSDGDLSDTAGVVISVAGSPLGDLVCEYLVTNDWGAGAQTGIRITNNTPDTVNGWEISWEYNDGTTVSSSWNANVTGNNPYTATNLSWNGTIGPDQSVEFGMTVNNGSSVAATPSISGCSQPLP